MMSIRKIAAVMALAAQVTEALKPRGTDAPSALTETNCSFLAFLPAVAVFIVSIVFFVTQKMGKDTKHDTCLLVCEGENTFGCSYISARICEVISIVLFSAFMALLTLFLTISIFAPKLRFSNH